MRRTLVSRSSFEKPRPAERLVRTTSPSSSSTGRPAARRRSTTMLEMVLLPAPERPVNQIVVPGRRSAGTGSHIGRAGREVWGLQAVLLEDHAGADGLVRRLVDQD